MEVSEFSLPEWVKEFRPHQVDAITDVVDAFDAGEDIVILNAPTGSGKTLIAETVRQLMNVQYTAYVCSDKSLQDQFLNDFPYARVLKGRANYPTQYKPFPDITCGDCTGKNCLWCDGAHTCPYTRAKIDAMAASLAVVNTSYFLAECNGYRSSLTGRDLVIVDECDLLEQELMRTVEFRISNRRLQMLDIEPPKKGVHKATLVGWMEEVVGVMGEWLKKNRGWAKGESIPRMRTYNSMLRGLDSAERVWEDIAAEEPGPMQNWVRDEDDWRGGFVLKPVKVDRFGKSMLWRHGKKWLLMSATVVSPDQMVESLGVEEE